MECESYLLGIVNNRPVLGDIGVEGGGQLLAGRPCPPLFELRPQLLVRSLLLAQQTLALVQNLGVPLERLRQLGNELGQRRHASGLRHGLSFVLQGLGNVGAGGVLKGGREVHGGEKLVQDVGRVLKLGDLTRERKKMSSQDVVYFAVETLTTTERTTQSGSQEHIKWEKLIKLCNQRKIFTLPYVLLG